MNNILEISNLTINAYIKNKEYNIINDISLNLKEKQTIAIVGESGSGKTLTALSIIKLLEDNLIIKSGIINYQGRNIFCLTEKELQKIRGKEISFVFQEPLTALDPVINIETQLTEGLITHGLASKEEAIKKSKEILEKLSIPLDKIKSYPHNFSGGQRQRILLAMALITNPRILIADEPTTALDAVTQMEILNLIEKLKEEKKLSVILITHNMAVVANYSDYTYVMYLGEIMEEGETYNIIKYPSHPYTTALLGSVVTLEKKQRLTSIKGNTPSIYDIPSGCRFITRCDLADEKCKKRPPLKDNGRTKYRCWNK